MGYGQRARHVRLARSLRLVGWEVSFGGGESRGGSGTPTRWNARSPLGRTCVTLRSPPAMSQASGREASSWLEWRFSSRGVSLPRTRALTISSDRARLEPDAGHPLGECLQRELAEPSLRRTWEPSAMVAPSSVADEPLTCFVGSDRTPPPPAIPATAACETHGGVWRPRCGTTAAGPIVGALDSMPMWGHASTDGRSRHTRYCWSWVASHRGRRASGCGVTARSMYDGR